MQTRAAFTGLPVVKRATLTVKHFSHGEINRDSLKKSEAKKLQGKHYICSKLLYF